MGAPDSGGMTGGQRVTCDRDAVQARGAGACLHESADGSRPDAVSGDETVMHGAREERTGSSGANPEPGIECADRIGQVVVASGHSYELAARLDRSWTGERR